MYLQRPWHGTNHAQSAAPGITRAMAFVPAKSRPGTATVLAVAALHACLIAAIASLGPPHPAPPPPDQSVPVMFTAAPSPQTPTVQPVGAEPVPQQTREVAGPLAPIPPVAVLASPSAIAMPPPRRLHPPAPRHQNNQAVSTASASASASARASASASATTSASATPQHAPAQPRPAPPAASAPQSPSPGALSGALAAWEARIRQAVQDAVVYPNAARMLRREGRAQVRFDYAQGAVAFAAIVQSSRVGALDKAALAAVTSAAIPRPPAALGSEMRSMVVWGAVPAGQRRLRQREAVLF